MRAKSESELLRRWHRQVAARRRRAAAYWPRPTGALGFLVNGGRSGDLVELHNLLTVVVYDEPNRRNRPAVRVCGYGACRVDHGVQWGAAANAKLFKNLAITPRPWARGQRLDVRNGELLELVLRLDHRINQAVRYEQSVRRRPLRLPKLWAGFKTTAASKLQGQGPEFEALCQRLGLPPAAMFEKFKRPYEGLMLCPMSWVSDQLAGAVTIFAELAGLPARQAFALGDFPTGLIGYQDAMAFDFYESPFRVVAHTKPRRAASPIGRTRLTG